MRQNSDEKIIKKIIQVKKKKDMLSSSDADSNSDWSLEDSAQEEDIIDGETLEGATSVSPSFEPDDLIEEEILRKEKHAGDLTPLPSVASGQEALDRYLAEIKRYPLLSREEEKELAIHYSETHDPQAAQALVKANLRFVVKIAMEYSKYGARLIDLVQEGNIGLMHAVKEFNPYKEVRLISYAVWWIRGYIQEYLMRQHSLVRIGTTQAQRKLFYQLQKQKDELEKLGEAATVKQLSGRLGVNEKDITTMSQRLSGQDVSLNQLISDGNSTHLIDLQTNPNEVFIDDQLGHLEKLEVLKEQLQVLRPHLNERELVILEERLLSDQPLTLQEIGDRYHTTREAARQVEARLIGKIKKLFLEKIQNESEDEDLSEQ